MSYGRSMYDDINNMEIALLVENINDYCGKELSKYSTKLGDEEEKLIDYKDTIEFFDELNISYLYFGSEFCEYKIPTVSEFCSFIQLCLTENLKPVLVTPPVTDYGIKLLNALLDEIENNNLSLDIVVNDVGVLQMIHNKKINSSIILGRIFDKMSHDSRASNLEFEKYYNKEGKKFATTPGIISLASKQYFNHYNIVRYEFDLPKIGISIPNDGGNYSLYWPYSYLTSGRVCFFRSILLEGREKFLVGNKTCNKICREYKVYKIKDIESKEKQYLLQKGNTIFYINDGRELEKYTKMFNRIVLQV